MDCNSQPMTNVDIDSGNIDATTIGGTTPAAGTFSMVILPTSHLYHLTPLIEIKNTNNDANRLRFTKDKGAAGAANDVNGLIEFYGDDANQDQVKFSEIKSQVKVATNGQEGGKFTISVAEHDGNSTAGLVIEDGDADGELDITIAAGSSSLTTAAGNMSVNGEIVSSGSHSIASAANASWGGLEVSPTLTFTGSTSVTNASPINMVNLSAPTLSCTNSMNVDTAASLYIGGAPTGGSLTINNSPDF